MKYKKVWMATAFIDILGVLLLVGGFFQGGVIGGGCSRLVR